MILDIKLRKDLQGLDPQARVERFFNPNFFTEDYYMKWHTLGFRMGLTKAISHGMLADAFMDGVDMERMIAEELIQEIVTAIIEGYIEYWHLYYEGDMSLKEFTGMTDDDLGFYLTSDGEYIGGTVYARARRLQQRDLGRFAAPERVIGADA